MSDINVTLQARSSAVTPVDSTMTMSGSAADAAAVGNLFADANTRISAAASAASAASTAVTTLRSELAAIKAEVLGSVYPVGAMYITTSAATSPATIFGGTWEQLSGGYVLRTAEDGETAGTTYAAQGHTHTVGGHAITVQEMPAHTHGTTVMGAEMHLNGAYVAKVASGATHDMAQADESLTVGTETVSNKASAIATSGEGRYVSGTRIATYTGKRGWKLDLSHSHATAGEGAAHTHTAASASDVPAHMAVYIWRRTA